MMRFMGTGTALITPFCDAGVDYAAMGRMIDWQIASRVDFLVVLGTTGEAPSVSDTERQKIVAFAVDRASGRLPVVVGTGGNSTEQAIRYCREAESLGADGVLVVTPYYNKPSQEGLSRHYEAISRSCDLPIVAYNVPGRTGVNMLPATVRRLADLPNVVGIKEACGNLAQVEETLLLLADVRPDFAVLSGNDDQTFHIVNAGGHGVISVLANIAPCQTAEMVRAGLAGDVAGARALHRAFFPLVKALFVETNPMPVKYAASRLGLCENRLRLPLVEASENCMSLVDAELDCCGVIETEEALTA